MPVDGLNTTASFSLVTRASGGMAGWKKCVTKTICVDLLAIVYVLCGCGYDFCIHVVLCNGVTQFLRRARSVNVVSFSVSVQ